MQPNRGLAPLFRFGPFLFGPTYGFQGTVEEMTTLGFLSTLSEVR